MESLPTWASGFPGGLSGGGAGLPLRDGIGDAELGDAVQGSGERRGDAGGAQRGAHEADDRMRGRGGQRRCPDHAVQWGGPRRLDGGTYGQSDRSYVSCIIFTTACTTPSKSWVIASSPYLARRLSRCW
jgi:hypothetical protein